MIPLPRAGGFYAIVDPAHTGTVDPRDAAGALLRGGAAILQLRTKLGTDRERLALARALASLAHDAGCPFVMNDRLDLALLAGADGVHLGQGDLSVADARQLLQASGREAFVGVSTHDAEQARRALADGADLIGLGPVFDTRTKERPDPTVGVEGLRRVAEIARRSTEARVPVVAIGGLSPVRAPEAYEAGATFVAAISAVTARTGPDAIEAIEAAARGMGRRGGGAP